MRRNNRGGNRGNRGGNRGIGNQNTNTGGNRALMGTSGPLATDHLQLRELDLELALLKRKREIIEEQHTMLVTESRGFNRGNQFAFNQQSQSFGQQPNRNMYADNSRRSFDPPQAVKRPAIDPWDNSAPSAKRYGGPMRRKPNPGFKEQKPPRSQPERMNNAPAYTSSGGASRADNRPSGRPRSNFRQNRVNKPKQTSVPNKLKSQPVAERKNLVKQASELVSKPIVTYVLEADRPAHPKLVGRLELALGSILREMREALGSRAEHSDTFQLGVRQRSLKQAVRERIRQVMLGKTVGVNAEVIATYRKTYPKETDLELLNKIRESNQPTSEIAIKLVQQANPEKYFKNNFTRLLSVSLTEMFERLKMLYTRENETKRPMAEIVNNLLSELENAIPEEEKKSLLETAVNGTEEEVTTKPAETSSNQEGKESTTDEDTKQEETSDAVITEQEEIKNAPEESEAKAECKSSEATAESQETPAEQDSSTTKVDSETSQIKVFSVTRFYQRLIETYLRKNLPSLLPKYKEYIVDIIGTDEAYKKTEAYLIRSTNEKAQKFSEKDAKKANTSENAAKKIPVPSNTTVTQVDRPVSKSDRQQYFVKVIGRPALPRKNIMKVFLDTFEPTLIKKHRNIYNILFISFDKQENYDNILAKNGTVIDSKKLEIKPSEKINKNKSQQQQDEEDSQDQSSNLNDSVISEGTAENTLASLDDQIDDLLTSIREEEGIKDNSDEANAGGNAESNTDGNAKANVEGDADAAAEYMVEETENDVQEMETKENTGTEVDDAQNGNQDDQNFDDQDEVVEVTKEEPQQDTGKSTRASARLATSTPTTVRTRRSSKLAQN